MATTLTKKDVCGSALLIDSIRRFDWKFVEYYCEHKPSFIEHTRTLGNNTVLHQVCSVGSAPNHIIELIHNVWAQATNVQNRYGDTPLHITTRTSSHTLYKVNLLMEFNPNALLVKNHLGYTPLAIAIVSGSIFPVIRMIVEKEPTLLFEEDENGRSPVQLLISSFQKNIPGSLALRSYLEGGMMSNILSKFWAKLQYLIMRTYERKLGKTFGSIDDNLLCHAILAQGLEGEILRQILAIALSIDKTLAMVVEVESRNSPLHILAERKDFIACGAILSKCPDAAMIKNRQGRLPLHFAMEKEAINSSKDIIKIHERGKLENIHERGKLRMNILKFVAANPEALEYQDTCGVKTGFYPYMIAAADGDLQLTLDMLLMRSIIE